MIPVALLLVTAAVAASPQPAPQPAPEAEAVSPPLHHLEVSLRSGGQAVSGEVAQPSLSLSDRTIGSNLGGSIALLTRYFLHPFVDVTHARLSTGTTFLPVAGPWGPPANVSSDLSTWATHVGAGVDVWRLRARFGIGFSTLDLSTSVGPTHEAGSTSLAGSGVVSLGIDLVRTPYVILDTEARAVALPSSGISWFALSLGLRSRVLTW